MKFRKMKCPKPFYLPGTKSSPLAFVNSSGAAVLDLFPSKSFGPRVAGKLADWLERYSKWSSVQDSKLDPYDLAAIYPGEIESKQECEHDFINEPRKLPRCRLCGALPKSEMRTNQECFTCDNGVIHTVAGFDPVHGEIAGEDTPCPDCDKGRAHQENQDG